MADQIIVQRTRNVPWVGIGAKGEWDDYKEALRAAGLDFNVYAQDVFWERPDGFTLDEIMASPDPNAFAGYPSIMERVPVVANVRGDTNQQLGVVTPRYRIVQNRDAFKIMEQVVRSGGVITNAGMTQQGLCFMVARMMTTSYNGEDYELNIMCTNSFNGAFPLALIITPVRIICQNMYKGLMASRENVVRFRHETNIGDRLDRAYDIVGYLNDFDHQLNAQLVQLAMAQMGKAEYDKLLGMVFPYPKPGGVREATSVAKVDALREMFTADYFGAPDNDPWTDTVFGFVNAYYDYLSHAGNTKNMRGSWDDKRLSKLVSGDMVDKHVIKEAIKIAKA